MTTHHFGTDHDPAQYAEVATVSVVDAHGDTVALAPRPAPGVELLVKDAAALTDLDPIVVGGNGYWDYATTDVPAILVSGDSWATSIGPLYSAEAIASAVAASAIATSAQATAVQALALAQQGGVASIDWGSVTGKPVPLTTPTAIGAVATASVGALSGVASLDTGGKVPIGQLALGTAATNVAVGNHTHSSNWSGMPSNSLGAVIYDPVAAAYPTRPTTRTDVYFEWAGPVSPPVTAGYAQAGDRWINVAST